MVTTMTTPTPEALRPWATVADHPCVTASCTDCGDAFGDEETGGNWHFESVAALLASVAQYVEDDYDDDGVPWQVQGDALLCRRCATARVCAAQGHLWSHEAAFVYDGRTTREYWYCSRHCGEPMRRTDPTSPMSVVEAGDPS